MPRLHGYRERTVRDFGWILPLTCGEKVELFNWDRVKDDLVGTGLIVHPGGLQATDGSIVVCQLAIDRPDVVVEIKSGLQSKATVCGPWLNPVVGQLWSIWADAMKEQRPEEAKLIAEEAKKESRKTGLGIAIVVPVRQNMQAIARLLDGAAEGQAVIHMRTLVVRDIR